MSAHRFVAAVILTLAGACASAGTQTDPPDNRTVLVDNGTAVRTSEMPASDQQFDAPAAKVWGALSGAYAAMGIDVVVRDPAARRMGNTNFYKTGRFGDQPVSRFADCGNGPNGPRANTSRVYFSVLTTLTAVDATHTRLSTDVEPVAEDMASGGGQRLTCGSTGALERMLYDAVARALAP